MVYVGEVFSGNLLPKLFLLFNGDVHAALFEGFLGEGDFDKVTLDLEK